MNWTVYTRGMIPLHRIAPVFEGISLLSKKKIDNSLTRALYVNIGRKLWWGWDSEELKKVAFYVIKNAEKKEAAENIFSEYEKYSRLSFAASNKIREADLKSLSGEQICGFYDDLVSGTAEAQGFLGGAIDAIDAFFDDFLLGLIKKTRPDLDKEQAEFVYSQISPSAYTTYINQEEIFLLEAALGGGDAGLLAEQANEKFWWTNLGWESIEPRPGDYFEKEIEKRRKEGGLGKKLEALKRRPEEVMARRKELIEKYGLAPEMEHWLAISDRFAFFHDIRKEIQVKMVHAASLLMRESARRLAMKEDDLEWLWFDEIKSALQGKKADLEEIEKRKKAICVLVEGGKISSWAGEEALKKLEREIGNEQVLFEMREFKGMAVGGGIVRGLARVCSGAKEALEKVKEGEILVCGMTVPDYVPAMKKAAAIITDEGGITCHAAILSRELGIPCVVGTKIATRILKNGDEVEVDAEKGIIKIISSKNNN